MTTETDIPGAAATGALATGTMATTKGTGPGTTTGSMGAAAATMIMATMDMDTAFNMLLTCTRRPPR